MKKVSHLTSKTGGACLLIVEDDETIRTQMKWALAGEYELFLAGDGETAIEISRRERMPLVTLDLGLPPSPEDTSEGLKLLDQILQQDPATKVIVITGNPDRLAGLRAISRGAHDFLTKPIEIEELKVILKRAFYVHTLETEYKELQKKIQETDFGEIIGSSPKIQEVFDTVRKVATTDVPVLITGESGTGKELVSRAIHSRSTRKDKPFVVINCGAIPENLMESELFGHEKGAFTGAHMQRKGKIELASGGTLFLDEIGELPLSLQVKILRFLQDHKIERIGGREMLEVDVRIIAATNRNLKRLVSEERFREELYYRLAVVSVELPPLREREGDMALLASAFLKRFSVGAGGVEKYFSSEAFDTINAYKWPGNVRELENRVRRAVALTESSRITPRDLDMESENSSEHTLNLKNAREKLEKKLINTAMVKHNGNISKAAEELGLSRPTLHYMMKKHNLKQEKNG